MSKDKKNQPRNFVHKASMEMNKPKVHRDRTKEYKNRTLKYEEYELERPVHKPYKREKFEDGQDSQLENYNEYDDEEVVELEEPEEWYTEHAEPEWASGDAIDKAFAPGMEPPDLKEDLEVSSGSGEGSGSTSDS